MRGEEVELVVEGGGAGAGLRRLRGSTPWEAGRLPANHCLFAHPLELPGLL